MDDLIKYCINLDWQTLFSDTNLNVLWIQNSAFMVLGHFFRWKIGPPSKVVWSRWLSVQTKIPSKVRSHHSLAGKAYAKHHCHSNLWSTRCEQYSQPPSFVDKTHSIFHFQVSWWLHSDLHKSAVTLASPFIFYAFRIGRLWFLCASL